MRLPQMPPLHTPFSPGAPVRSLQDVERHEARPLAEALPVQSTYEIFVNSAAAFGDKTALSFLPTADPADEPIRWSYAQLLTGIHQTANLLHHLGVGPQDAVAVLLPGCLEYHLALWGGEAAGIVQPLNPLLSEDKLVSLLRASGAQVLHQHADGMLAVHNLSKLEDLAQAISKLMKRSNHSPISFDRRNSSWT